MQSTQKWALGLATGLGAGLVTALIGASWQIVSRSAAITPLGPVELAVLRYVIPGVCLLPALRGVGLLPKAMSRSVLIALMCGGGLPFGLLAFAGTRFAPAAHMGVMVAATGPLITAMLMWIVDRTRVSPSRGVGLLLIAAGVTVLGARAFTSGEQAWIGDIFFLLAALCWGGYGIAFRKSGLTPWQGAALVNAWSALLLLPIILLVGVDGFFRVDTETLALQALWQGVIAGLFGGVTYIFAVRQLGANGAAAFGALVPVLSAVGGWIILSEAMTPTVVVASVLAMLGVALAVGLFERRNRKR
jgi:drug/metabolite transporter (DMT)-like permease